jgi:hypothetical protein
VNDEPSPSKKPKLETRGKGAKWCLKENINKLDPETTAATKEQNYRIGKAHIYICRYSW